MLKRKLTGRVHLRQFNQDDKPVGISCSNYYIIDLKITIISGSVMFGSTKVLMQLKGRIYDCAVALAQSVGAGSG
jgi:hypothetical protein